MFIVTSESEERRKVKDQTRSRVLQGNYNRIPGKVSRRIAIPRQFSARHLKFKQPGVNLRPVINVIRS